MKIFIAAVSPIFTLSGLTTLHRRCRAIARVAGQVVACRNAYRAVTASRIDAVNSGRVNALLPRLSLVVSIFIAMFAQAVNIFFTIDDVAVIPIEYMTSISDTFLNIC